MKAIILDGKPIRELSVSEVREAVAAGEVVWVDLGDKNAEMEQLLLETFKIHPLTVEDVWNTNELPKVEDFGIYLNVIAHSVHADSHCASVKIFELDILLGEKFVLTHSHDERVLTSVRDELERRKTISRQPAWVAHALLDRMVDDYLPLIDRYDDEIAKLELEVIRTAGTPEGPRVMLRIFALKRTLQAVRRTNVHQREVLLRLARGEFDEIPRDMVPFFRDVYDQFARINELVESYRELLSNALEAYLSMQSNRMNEVMKTLTLISTVMLPLTFIAGVYGMNFDVMPELRWKYGYVYAIALMGVVAALITRWFKHKKWV